MKQALPFVLLGAAALAACSESARDEHDTDLPSAPGGIVTAPPVKDQPLDCSFKDAYSYARNYFLVNTDRNAATTDLQTAESSEVGTFARTDALFSVLERVAKVGGTTNGNTGTSGSTSDSGDPPLAGANLVNEIVDCGPLVVTDKRDFVNVVLKSALTDGEGEFAIRGTTAGSDRVEAESGDVAIAPNVDKDDWMTQVGRVAVFVGQVAGVGFGGLGTNLVASYRIGLIYEPNPPRSTPPDFSDDDYFAVEFCGVDPPPQGVDPGKQRVGRSRGQNNELNTVLQQADVQEFCTDLPPPSPALSRSFFERAVDRLAGFFLPTTLQALMFAPPPWSGSTGGLESDFGVVQVDNVTVTVPTIDNGVRGQAVPFTTTAFTNPPAPNTPVPLENVVFTVSVVGNQGDPVLLTPGNSTTTCNTTSCTADTDEFGLANFSIIFDKAGGYTVEVKASFSGFPDIVVTRSFNITGA